VSTPIDRRESSVSSVPPAGTEETAPAAAPGSEETATVDAAGQPPRAAERDAQSPRRPPRTRVSAAFIAASAALVLLVLLLVFMLENTERVAIHFLGAKGHLSLGLALLVAAVGGGLIVAVLAIARIVQLRRLARRAGTS
jgi:uncharacterized integral membrane protein